MANRLPTQTRVLALTMLVEGSSMRSVSRTLGISINTVSKLLIDAGRVCAEYHDKTVRNVRAGAVQCDEIWSFTYAKERNAARATGAWDKAGDTWTWTGIDRESKLIISWLIGGRDAVYALEFMDDLQARLAHRVQLTTDGLGVYLEAVDEAFGGLIDYAQVVKLYGPDPEDPKGRRYSPPKCVRIREQAIQGTPNMDAASTSHVERHNLTMRMSMRRFTRLTNAFSKKIENHAHAVAFYFVYYNFCRPHKSLKGKTPAQAAGLARYKRDIRWIVEMIDKAAPKPKRGPYKAVAEQK